MAGRTHTERDLSIDTMRAIACIALVSYHAVGNSPQTGMELPSDHWLSILNDSFVDMRMPLFSFLSGLVFVRLTQLTRSPGQMVISKMRRLLVPMVAVGLLFWCTRQVMGYEQQPLLSILVLPYAHFWFLQATFVIMALFLVLYWLVPGRDGWLAVCLLLGGAGVWISGLRPAVNLFSVAQAAYLMPFFMLGYILAQPGHLAKLRHRVGRVPAGVVGAFVLAAGICLATGIWQIDMPVGRRVATVVIGLAFCTVLLVLAPRNAPLARLGGYSYTIYLFHVFFTAGAHQIVTQVFPQVSDGVMWLIAVAVGLTGPVALHLLLQRGPSLLRFVFLGQRVDDLRWRPVPGPVA